MIKVKYDKNFLPKYLNEINCDEKIPLNLIKKRLMQKQQNYNETKQQNYIEIKQKQNKIVEREVINTHTHQNYVSQNTLYYNNIKDIDLVEMIPLMVIKQYLLKHNKQKID